MEEISRISHWSSTLSRLTALTVLAFVMLAAPATASLSLTAGLAAGDAINLGTDVDFRIDGVAKRYSTGNSVAGAGDVNGDGLDDVIVGAPFAGTNNGYSSGSAYVVYGKGLANAIDLGTLDQSGFRIDGGGEDDFAGWSVAGAGDVNGDGLDDVIVGATGADNNGDYSGSVYVVYGKNSTDTVNLANIGTPNNQEGFRVDGASKGDSAGFSVAGVSDLNGDGLDELIIGAPYASNNDRPWSGSAYVVYGKKTTEAVDLANDLGSNGFRIDGATEYDHAGYSVAGSVDLNGDKRDDVIVGAPSADSNGASSGSTYVIYGGNSTGSVDLSVLGQGGFRIDGATEGETVGSSVAGAGDVNGDDLNDVIVGAPFAGNNGTGSAYVVYGKKTTEAVDLANDLGSKGFRLNGAGAGDNTGYSVAGVGDVNDDGWDDVAIGAPYADNNGSGSGSTYVIYGTGSTDNVNLEDLDHSGLRLDGGAVGESAGWSVAGAGDVNGYGGSDLIIGAPNASNNGPDKSGSAYIVHSDAAPGNKALSGTADACTRSVYENRLVAPREVRLRDLISGRGIKLRASAGMPSRATLKLELVGEDARRLRLYGKESSKKSKLIARKKFTVDSKSKDIYLKARGTVRKQIKRALKKGKAPKRVRLKITLTTHSTTNTLLARRNTLTIRAYKSTKQRANKTNARVSRMHGGSGCAEPLQLKIKGPKKVGISSLISRSASQGKGVKVKVRCSEDCTARVGIRMWGRFEVGSGLRKRGKKKPRWLTSRKVKLKAGQSRTVTLKGPSSKKLRKQLQRASLKKRYKRIKLKYSIEARTTDEKSAGDAGTLRVPLRFR